VTDDISTLIDYPKEEELTVNEWKLLFMLLCENRAGLELDKGLTPYGKELLRSVQRKLGINVVGVDVNAKEPNRVPLS
jgi:hypothetical protein